MSVITGLKPNLNDIYHYGVLGMKWGIRKDRFYANGGVIRKGAKLNRLTTNLKEKNSGRLYANLKNGGSIVGKEALDFYKEYVGSKNVDTKLYQMDMKTKVDLILPSMKEKGESFANVFLKNEGNAKLLAKSKVKDAIEESYGGLTKSQQKAYFKDILDSLNKAKVVYTKNGFELDDDGVLTSVDSIKNLSMKSAYVHFTISLNDRKISDLYCADLKKKGYNAISDDADMWDAKTESVYKLSKVAQQKQEEYSKKAEKAKTKEERDKHLKSANDIFEEYEKWSQLPSHEKRKEFTGNAVLVFDRKSVIDVVKVTKVK
jgi:hypothetical protein